MNPRTALAAAFVLGALLCAGLLGLGALATRGFLAAKSLERTVTVRGLSERVPLRGAERARARDGRAGDAQRARVASRFAKDSDSTLGEIRSASQGPFSIDDRDGNTPDVKKVRGVSTVEYYLSD